MPTGRKKQWRVCIASSLGKSGYYNYFIIMNYFALNPSHTFSAQQPSQTCPSNSALPTPLIIRGISLPTKRFPLPSPTASKTIIWPPNPTKMTPSQLKWQKTMWKMRPTCWILQKGPRMGSFQCRWLLTDKLKMFENKIASLLEKGMQLEPKHSIISRPVRSLRKKGRRRRCFCGKKGQGRNQQLRARLTNRPIHVRDLK